jgi:hypothetical protein
MDLLIAAFIGIFTSGITIVTYKSYAIQKAWPIGKWYYQESSFINLTGGFSLISSFILSFFFLKWYFPLIGAPICWIISMIITNIFKSNVQWVILLVLFVSIILLNIGIIIR